MAIGSVVNFVGRTIYRGVKVPQTTSCVKSVATPIVQFGRATTQKAGKKIPKLTTAKLKAIQKAKANMDKTLEPKFLKGLLNEIKNLKTCDEKVNTIVYQMLEKMGYKGEYVKQLKITPIDDVLSSSVGAFNRLKGELLYNPRLLTEDEHMICTIRHELEHLNQHVKLYKSIGKEKLLEAYAHKSNCSIKEVEELFNEKFYETMAKHTNTKGFDADGFYKGFLAEYPKHAEHSPLKLFYYMNNPFEKGAFSVERKCNEVLMPHKKSNAGIYLTPKLYSNCEEITMILNKEGVQNIEEQQKILNGLNTLANINVSGVKNSREMLQVEKRKLTNGWTSIEQRIQDMMTETVFHQEFDLLDMKNIDRKAYSQMLEWIRKGKFTPEDVITDILGL